MVAINEAFKELNADKQKKILNAAFEEFAYQGYKKASTNNIVKKAGISKGMLFYYFNSKKELYLDLIDYGISYMENELLSLIDENQSDFIEKFRQLSSVKKKAYKENREIFHFFSTAYLEPDELSKEYIDKILESRRLAISKIYSNIDMSLFRKDIQTDKSIQLIKWCIEGYEKDLTQNLKESPVHISEMDIEYCWKEYYSYLDILKTVFYEKEEDL